MTGRRAEWDRLRAEHLRPKAERPPSSARGVHHVALLSSDVERTIHFYQDVLEFPLTDLFENRDYEGSTHFFFDLGNDFPLIGASPEMMVRLEDGIGTVRPIAGTRRRGANEAEDKALEEEMLADPKECAEHVMLVDLGRNDLGRVCEYGTVRVPRMMVVERYSHVMHIVSHVNGKLRKGINAFDLIRATFPAGTLSGAPKIRAMEIIEELEGTRRGRFFLRSGRRAGRPRRSSSRR